MKKAFAITSLCVFLLLGLVPPVGCATFLFGATSCPFMNTVEAGCDSPCCATSEENATASNFLECLLHEMPCCIKTPKDVTPPAAMKVPAQQTLEALPLPTALSFAPALADRDADALRLPEPTGPPPPILYLQHCSYLI